MSEDSDSTLPATDDFGSRFLEFDEYSEEQSDEEEVFTVLPPIDRPSNISNLSSNGRSSSSHKSDISKSNALFRRRNSSQRGRKRSNTALEIKSEAIDDGGDDSIEDEELSTFRNPKLLTARQMSLKSQRNLSSSRENSFGRTPSESTFLSLESLETSKSTAVLTPEQVAAHQKRVAHRRETAKHKAELEKRQTVERLLKINANSIGRRGRRRGRNIHESFSTASLVDTTDNTTLINESSPDLLETAAANTTDEKSKSSAEISGPSSAPETTNEHVKVASNKNDHSESQSDKGLNQTNKYGITSHMPNLNAKCIRIISSSRINPSKLVCFPQTNHTELEVCTNLWSHKPVPPIPQPRLCDLGCGRLRRYACAKTGRSLCSLNCYKQNLSIVI